MAGVNGLLSRTNRNFNLLAVDGFTYVKHRDCPDGTIQWRCRRSVPDGANGRRACNGRISSMPDGTQAMLVAEHVEQCRPDTTLAMLRHLKAKMRQEALDTDKSIKQIFEETVASVSDKPELVKALGILRKGKSCLYRARAIREGRQPCIQADVWSVFTPRDNASGAVMCTLCGKQFKFNTNTKCIRAHLSKVHPHVHEQLLEEARAKKLTDEMIKQKQRQQAPQAQQKAECSSRLQPVCSTAQDLPSTSNSSSDGLTSLLLPQLMQIPESATTTQFNLNTVDQLLPTSGTMENYQNQQIDCPQNVDCPTDDDAVLIINRQNDVAVHSEELEPAPEVNRQTPQESLAYFQNFVTGRVVALPRDLQRKYFRLVGDFVADLEDEYDDRCDANGDKGE